MRPLRLARIAAEAEGVRLRQLARRTVFRAVCGIVALVFLAGALAFCHFAIWFWLRQSFAPPAAALIIAGGDLLLAIVLGVLAARSSPGRVEVEALAVRRRAVESITGSIALTTLGTQLLGLAIRVLRRRR
jgi:hypothetical protein